MAEKKNKAFKKAMKDATIIAEDKQKTSNLLDKAEAKAKNYYHKISSFKEDLFALFRLLRYWQKGIYTNVPWRTIIMSIAGILYFLNPFDLIMDLTPIVGFLDDATVIGFVMASIKKDIDKFREWEGKITDYQIKVS